jgi:hypothetical protein
MLTAQSFSDGLEADTADVETAEIARISVLQIRGGKGGAQ